MKNMHLSFTFELNLFNLGGQNIWVMDLVVKSS